MTYGRSIFKALALFQIDTARWHELAVDRGAWRETLRTGLAPPTFRPTPSPRISRTKPVRECVAASTAGWRASLKKEEALLD